ncbi:hypothetical protein TSUD_100320 [Trifolium subterraneum]|uniref:Beta-glucosidase n=1 Tax=Trifolium subterraneum TaxID=3900 RepID=A0A2Z6P736_TRISU|nr:hypothetical protein TSUD_100320 [Trifolium subterraneum]
MPKWLMQVVLLTLFCSSFTHVQSSHEIEEEEDEISKSQFPKDFLFGTSTSSYQIEGAAFEDGRGLSNWDVFSHTPGMVNNDENGDIADDHYHHYLEDVKLMSSLGINVYRFSISWTRILPKGLYGDINPTGIMFYNNLIDNLLLRGSSELMQAKQGGTIGIVAHTLMYEPLRDEECDRQAAKRALAFIIGWFLDPLVFGEYPAEMRSILGNQLPKLSPKEKSLLRGSLDFIGINHYGALYAKDCYLSACPPEAARPIKGFLETTPLRDGIPIAMAKFFVVPKGMEKIVDYIKIKYHNLPMYITENGYSSPLNESTTMHDVLHDFKRIEYHKAYLAALLRAIR